jgi:hypothetical protein
MDLLDTWRSLYSLRYVPVTLVQVVFSAGTVFLLSAIQATSGVRFAPVSLNNSLSQAELCIAHLNEIGRSDQCSKNVSGILAHLLQEQLKPKLSMRSLGPSRPLSRVNFASKSQMPSKSSQMPAASSNQSPVANEAFPEPPLRDVHQPNMYYHLPHLQTDHVEQSTAWTAYAVMHTDGNGINGPGPPFGNAAFGPPVGLGMMGGDTTLSNRPFMPLTVPEPICYDEAFQLQLGLSQDSDQGPQQPELELTEEEYDRLQKLQQFLDQHLQSFGVN